MGDGRGRKGAGLSLWRVRESYGEKDDADQADTNQAELDQVQLTLTGGYGVYFVQYLVSFKMAVDIIVGFKKVNIKRQ
jgi:hypothetical protein